MERVVDGIAFSFSYDYDSMNRPVSITYPDGSEVKPHYSTAGKLAAVTLDDYAIVEYRGPLPGMKLERRTGNGVKTEIDYDGVRGRATAYRTFLASGIPAQNINFIYDMAGNITRLENQLFPIKSQEFTYDTQGRVLSATGPYGDLTYTYQHGNLTQMGERTIQYANPAHPHRATAVIAPAGPTVYDYDAMGNVRARGDTRFDYNGLNRLSRVLGPNFDERYRYYYEGSGNRIKKVSVANNATTYYIDGLYELTRAPGQPDKHTLYVKGALGEIVSQYTRENVTLAQVNDQARFVALSGLGWSGLIQSGSVLFVLKMHKAALEKKARTFFRLHNRKLSPRVALVILTLAALLYGLWIALRKEAELKPAYAFPVPLLSLAILFTMPGCFALDQFTGVKKDGPPPWLALAAIPQNQAAVSDNPGVQPGPGIYDPGTHGMPSVGMFYFHPDHLGSVTMITDSYGNYVSGVDIGTGASHISYKPYGEINRTNSGGPDIFRYKYTQQEEDPETGLFYYKFRHYDPYIARFIQPDSYVFPGRTGGMNRYMYVHGNPVRFSDPTGHFSFEAMGKAMLGGIKWAASGVQGAAQWAAANTKQGAVAFANKAKAVTDRVATGKTKNEHAREQRARGFIGDAVTFTFGLLTGNPLALSSALGSTALKISPKLPGFLAEGAKVASVAVVAPFVPFGCLLLAGPCAGYVLGGAGGSSIEKGFHWNERSARAGAYLGAVAQGVAMAGAAGYVAYGTYGVSGKLAAELAGGMSYGQALTLSSFLLATISEDPEGFLLNFIPLPGLGMLRIVTLATREEYQRRLQH